MPWRQTSPMDQKLQFIADYLRRTLSITELCALYGVSRKKGYKWIERYLTSGPPGLEDRSRTHSLHGGYAWVSSGTITGSTSHTSASEQMSASKKSMMASGMSPSAHSHSVGSSNAICASKMPMVNSHDTGDCDPCLRTILLPISPAGQ
jgi:transposase-like protein